MTDTVPEGATSRTKPTVWLVLPAYNEEASIPTLLDRIDQAMFEVDQPYECVVVDDGSTDRTYEIAARAAETLPVRIERHAINQGLGATIRDGLVTAAGLAARSDVIVSLDADNTHTPALIGRMLTGIREGHDVVIASRYRPGSRIRGLSLQRRVLSRVASIIFRLLFPTKGVRDYTTGFRAYRASVLQDVFARHGREFIDQEGFQAMVDILLKLRRDNDLIFGEVPLILRYDQKDGTSKMDVSATTKNTLRLIVERRLSGR